MVEVATAAAANDVRESTPRLKCVHHPEAKPAFSATAASSAISAGERETPTASAPRRIESRILPRLGIVGLGTHCPPGPRERGKVVPS
jgi:hypothetical protein